MLVTESFASLQFSTGTVVLPVCSRASFTNLEAFDIPFEGSPQRRKMTTVPTFRFYGWDTTSNTDTPGLWPMCTTTIFALSNIYIRGYLSSPSSTTKNKMAGPSHQKRRKETSQVSHLMTILTAVILLVLLLLSTAHFGKSTEIS